MICYKSSTSKRNTQHPTALNGHLQAAFQLRHSASCAGCAQPGRPGPAQLDARLEACSVPGGASGRIEALNLDEFLMVFDGA